MTEPPNEDDRLAEQYGQVCDVIYRAMQGWPLEPDEENPFSHTSKEARAAALRIFEILGCSAIQ